ncbi:MAG: serine hydrolase domain-containing protein [Bacteroidota bacterium]
MRKILFLLWISGWVLLTGAQNAGNGFLTGQPEDAGMSSMRLQKAGELIDQYIADGKLPGGVFMAVRYGQVVFLKAAGNRSVDPPAPYRENDIFRIASMTKAVTSVAIMQLYEDGRLGIDDPVYKYLPSFEKQTVLDKFNEKDSTWTTVPVKSPVTIRHLLTHTSGITYGEFNRGKIMAVYQKNNVLNAGLSHAEWTSEEFIDRLGKTPLVFQPGERYLYGLNMDVMGRIVEVVSGETLQDYFRKNIFEPLGMEDTWFYLPADRHDRLVPVYTVNREGQIVQADASNAMGADINYPLREERPFYAGGGGLASTAKDYARFIQALVNEGVFNGSRILSRKTIEMMTSDQMILLNKEGKGISSRPGETFCLGFSLLTEEGNGINSKSPGTYEWGGYFNTKFFIDPYEHMVFTAMTQIAPFPNEEFWGKLYAILYSAIED